MRENHFRKVLMSGHNAIGTFITLKSLVSAEAIGKIGLDFAIVDEQHGEPEPGSTSGIMTALSTGGTTPVVRVPWNNPASIMRALDHGAYAVVCPMINSVKEAEDFVAAVRYPPQGIRSWGPIRGLLYGGPDYAAEANGTVMAIGMIETRPGLENLERILAVDGLDGVYVGPNDLGFSLGYGPKPVPEAEEVRKAIAHIAKTASSAGKPAGIHCANPDMAQEMLDLGFRFATIGTDQTHLVGALKQSLAAMG